MCHRPVVKRRRRLCGSSHHGLYDALAERAFTQNERAIVVLEGAGENLGSGRGEAVDQHHDREIRDQLRPTVAVGVGPRFIRVGVRDTLHGAGQRRPGLQEEVGQHERLVEEAAGVPTQVDDEPPRIGELCASAEFISWAAFRATRSSKM